MPRRFKLPALPKVPSLTLGPYFAALKDTRIRLRVLLGILLAANLVAAGFAFHLFDESPEQLARQVQNKRQDVLKQVVKLNQSRALASNVKKGRDEGTKFIATYMTSRRLTYSTIITELNQMAGTAGMKPKDAVIGLDAIQGTESLDMLTITYSFEGRYQNLVKFVNLIDRSPRFLIIESLSASQQQNGTVQVTLKIDTFVKDDVSAS